jgi:DNA invertase Pin-like site-specific DNA recombinase
VRTHKGKIHFVVVYNLTRFAREKYDHFALRAFLKSLGISLRSAIEPMDDTSTGKLMEGVLAAVAQFDTGVRAERTRAGMRAALYQGRWTFRCKHFCVQVLNLGFIRWRPQLGGLEPARRVAQSRGRPQTRSVTPRNLLRTPPAFGILGKQVADQVGRDTEVRFQ